MTETRTLLADPEPLSYRLARARRKTLCLLVRPDGSVEVRAPLRLALAEIEAFVHARLDWVRRKQAEFAARPKPVLAEGGTVPFLGEALTLSLSTGPRRSWREGAVLHLRLPEPAELRARLEAWYRREAEHVLAARYDAVWALAEPWGLPKPPLRLRWMRSRWGSCTRDGRICLNVQLVKAHPAAIDYVIAHEFCHLREFNHGPRFYALLETLLPDWSERRTLLRAVGSLRDD